MAANPTVLITGAGAPGIRGTIFAIRAHQAVAGVRLLAVDSDAEAIGRHWVDGFWQVPHGGAPVYAEAMLRICRDQRIDFVMPQTTAELLPLARARDQFRAIGTHVMVSPAAAIEIANSKTRLAGAFQLQGLPAPRWLPADNQGELERAVHQLGYPAAPVVVKPEVSNGMRGLRILRERAWNRERFFREKPDGTEISLGQLLEILDDGGAWTRLMVSEYLPGPEYSVDVYIGEHGAAAVARRRARIRSGITFAAEIERHPEMEAWSVAAARAIGLRYAVGFQYKLDSNGVAKVLECNPRVQGTMVASVFSGTNIIGLALEDALTGGLVAEIPEPRPASFCRFWGGLGMTAGDQPREI